MFIMIELQLHVCIYR